jgi:serine/threonine-protein kinase PRP4
MRPRSQRSGGEPRSADGNKWKASNKRSNHRTDSINTSGRMPAYAPSPQHAHYANMDRTGNRGHGFRGNEGLDRQRSRSPYRADRRERSRSRSPYRNGKFVNNMNFSGGVGGGATSGATSNYVASGEKRRRGEDHYGGRGGSDQRRFKRSHEEDYGSRGRSGGGSGYDASNGAGQYGRSMEARGSDYGGRDRSRSPYHSSRDGDRRSTPSDSRRPSTSDGASPQQDTRNKPTVPQHPKRSSDDASLSRCVSPSFSSAFTTDLPRSVDAAKPSDVGQEAGKEPKRQLSEAELIEQGRQRRKAIMAKHALRAQEANSSTPASPAPAQDSSVPQSAHQSPPSVASPQTQASPRALLGNADEELANHSQASPAVSEEAGMAAADYDPNADMEADRKRQANQVHQPGPAQVSAPQAPPQQSSIQPPPQEEEAPAVSEETGMAAADYDPNADMEADRKRQANQVHQSGPAQVSAPQEPLQHPSTQLPAQEGPAASKEFDMFGDDDMFAGLEDAPNPVNESIEAKVLGNSFRDTWDDQDGHYIIHKGDLLRDRYTLMQLMGKGTFAKVVLAKDKKTGQMVAIKISASRDTMHKAARKEAQFFRKLNEQDSVGKKYIIQMIDHFDHKGHKCIVFEALSMDLREKLKKVGYNVGMAMAAVRLFAQQMFLALAHLMKCHIIHADLKPDNILISGDEIVVKICDFGTAMNFDEPAEITSYMQSRYYRAPEVILGMKVGYEMDMWAIGCTLYELYVGRILFDARDNNQMLKMIQECRGKLPIRMLKRGEYVLSHYEHPHDIAYDFISKEFDKTLGKYIHRRMDFKNNAMNGKDLKSRLKSAFANPQRKPGEAQDVFETRQVEEARDHQLFLDLLDKCLQVDPMKRITPKGALQHGFFTEAAERLANKKASAQAQSQSKSAAAPSYYTPTSVTKY